MPLFSNTKITVNQYINGNYNIPDFQRNDFIHKNKTVIMFISEILKGYKIGVITIAHFNKKEWIIDGQQRLCDINRFISDDIPYTISENAEWYEKELFIKELSGKRFSDFPQSQRYIIENYELDICYLKCSYNEAKIYYNIMNSGTSLNGAERIHGNTSGKLYELSGRLSKSTTWVTKGIYRQSSFRRMGSEKMVNDLFALILYKEEQESKHLKKLLNAYSDITPKKIEELEKTYIRVTEHLSMLIPNIAFTRYRKCADYYTLFQTIYYFLSINKKLTDKEGAQKELSKFDKEDSFNMKKQQYIHASVQGNDHKSNRRTRFLIMKELLNKYYN